MSQDKIEVTDAFYSTHHIDGERLFPIDAVFSDLAMESGRWN
jgi:hypothetical protein